MPRALDARVVRISPPSSTKRGLRGRVTWKACRSPGTGGCGRGRRLWGHALRPAPQPVCLFSELGDELSTHVKPLTDMVSDLNGANPPAFVWVTPNMLDDMHDGPLTTGDTWLSQQIPRSRPPLGIGRGARSSCYGTKARPPTHRASPAGMVAISPGSWSVRRSLGVSRTSPPSMTPAFCTQSRMRTE